MRKYFLVVLFFTYYSVTAQNLPVKYLGIENGLSNNAVTCTYKDHNGFMWFATYDGLNKFDGSSFTVFRNRIGDSTSLIGNEVYTIAEDAQYNLWVTGKNGASVYHPATNLFSPIRYFPFESKTSKKIDFKISGVFVQKNGFVFLITDDEGVLLFSANNEQGEQIPLIDGNLKRTHYKVTTIKINNKNDDVWVFVDEVGLCKYDKRSNTIQLVNGNAKQANCIEIDRNQYLWLGSDKGLFKYNPSSNTLSENWFKGNYRITDLLISKNTTLWIASDGKGVLLMDLVTKQLKPLLSSDGKEILNSSSIIDLFKDEQERMWISTLRGGINIIEPKENPFKSIVYNDNKITNPNINFVSSFAEASDGKIWIGSNGSGLRNWDRKKNTFTFYNSDANSERSLSSNLVTSVIEDYKKTIWVSTWYGGVNRYDQISNSFEHYTCFNPKTGLEEKQVWFLYEDKEKNLWASTSNDGTLYILNRVTKKFELYNSNLVNIQCLAEDKGGNLWAGNYSSLIKIDKKTKQNTSYFIGYTVRSIHEDRNGNFWVATQGGGLLLFNRNTGTYIRYDESKGLQSNTILRILEDNHGNLWMSSFTGLIKYDSKKKLFIKFSKSDGLQSNQFSFNGAAILKSGEFLFGGIKGFNVFNPDSVYTSAVKTSVYLTGIHINGESLEANISSVTKTDLDKIQELTIPYDKAYISLDYVAPEYAAPDKIRYRYYLEGWDKKFSNSNTGKSVTYSHLPEGTYYFKVKATDILGIWGVETVLVKIKVLPPWYRTVWAYLFYLLLVASLIYLFICYKSNQHKLKYEVRLALLAAEKEKELTEKKISFFTHISHEFRTPLTLIINPLKEMVFGKNGVEDTRLTVVYRNARRLLSLVDQLLLFRKVEADEQQVKMESFAIADLCHEVYLCFQQHAQAKHIQFYFEGIDNKIGLVADKEKIEIILFNLLSNAFKFTPNDGTVTLSVIELEQQVEIRVADSGCGISKEVRDNMFQAFYQINSKEGNHPTGFGIGLYLSKKLAEVNGGSLYFMSEEGKGATFILQLPKSNASLVIKDGVAKELIESSFLHELVEEVQIEKVSLVELSKPQNKSDIIQKLSSELPSMLIVDDNKDMRDLLRSVFKDSFFIYEAESGEEGFESAKKEHPEIIISDIIMRKMSGIELCNKIKADPSIGHIPVILITASASTDNKLKGIEGGAEDYITKPFDNEIVLATVKNILKRRNRLQQYFFNTVTLQPNFSIDSEYKNFIEECILITEKHLDDPDFSIKTFSREIGMSHPKLYKKVKSVSGLSVNVFIRYLRLRKAAELLINTNKTINEVTYEVGFRDIKYFREQFFKLFEINPSEYIKRYRKQLGNKLNN